MILNGVIELLSKDRFLTISAKKRVENINLKILKEDQALIRTTEL
jgi:hypothetical protein